MSERVTLEQLEEQIAQLPPHEQLKLVAYISKRLSELTLPETAEEHQRRQYRTQIEKFLKLSDEMAAETLSEVDSAEDIRQIREARTAQLC